MASSSFSRKEPGIGVAFRYLADQHLKRPGKINEYAVKDHFTKVTQSSEWGEIGQEFARTLNSPPAHDDMKPIQSLVGKMGFDQAVSSLSRSEDVDSHEAHAQLEQIERMRQKAFEPVAALIDSSEWAKKDKATFYEDAYRVADMIHTLHVSADQQDEVSAVIAHQMSPTALHHYHSSVAIGEPSEMVGAGFSLKKAAQSFGRKTRKVVGKGKEALRKRVASPGVAQQPIVLLRNGNTLTAKVYLEKGQIRQLFFAGESVKDAEATAANEKDNYYKLSDDVLKEFGIRAYYFDRDQISSLLPRSVQRMWCRGKIAALDRSAGSQTTTNLNFEALDWSFSSLGYFEDYRSEYPLGQACIWKLDGADVPERNSSAAEQKTISVTAGAALSFTIEVLNEFEHKIYTFVAATANFQGNKRIGEEWTQSQKIYRSNVTRADSGLNTQESPMRDAWKDGNVRVFQFDLDKVKPVSGPSMVGEAGDYKTIAPRLLLFCEYGANRRKSGSASRSQDTIRPTYAMLMIPTITRMNHKVMRIPRK